MKKEEKCIEYYFDSQKYNQIQIIDNMEKEKLEFPNEQMELKMFLNKYGIYEVKLVFSNNKISILKEKIQDKMQYKIGNVQNIIKKYIRRDINQKIYSYASKIFNKFKIKGNFIQYNFSKIYNKNL